MGFLHEHQKLSPQSGWMYVHSKHHLSDSVILGEVHVIVLPEFVEKNEYVLTWKALAFQIGAYLRHMYAFCPGPSTLKLCFSPLRSPWSSYLRTYFALYQRQRFNSSLGKSWNRFFTQMINGSLEGLQSRSWYWTCCASWGCKTHIWLPENALFCKCQTYPMIDWSAHSLNCEVL